MKTFAEIIAKTEEAKKSFGYITVDSKKLELDSTCVMYFVFIYRKHLGVAQEVFTSSWVISDVADDLKWLKHHIELTMSMTPEITHKGLVNLLSVAELMVKEIHNMCDTTK